MKKISIALTTALLSMVLMGLDKAETIEEGLQLAKQTGKPLLVDFYAEWCGPCKRFAKAAKSDKDIVHSLEQVVLVKVDAEKGDGIKWAKKYEVTGYPTFILMNGEMEEVNRWSGYEKDHFIGKLDGALKDPVSIAVRKERYGQKKTIEDALVLADIATSAEHYGQALEYLTDANALQPNDAKIVGDLLESKMYAIAKKQVEGAFTDLRQELNSFINNENWALSTRVNIAASSYAMAGKLKLEGEELHYLKSLYTVAHQDAASFAGTIKSIGPAYAMKVEHDHQKAVVLKKEQLPQDWMSDGDLINNFAWWCFENNINLEEANALCDKGLPLLQEAKNKAMLLDTKAEIENALGHPAKALQLIEQAIEATQGEESYYHKQKTRFEKLAENAGTKES